MEPTKKNSPELLDRVRAALQRPHRLGMIGGDLEDQLAHCASFSRVLAQVEPTSANWHPAGRAVDLGTGGGLPGLYLATAHPQWAWNLVEMRQSRATEVERAALAAGLDAEVVIEPAQQLGHHPAWREQVVVVVARAFGPPALVAECAAGLLVDGGVLVVSEPPDTAGDRWPRACLGRLGLSAAVPLGDQGHQFVAITKAAPAPLSIPRKPPRADRGWW